MRSSKGIPFAIDVKGEDKRQGELKEHHDRGSNMMTGGARKLVWVLPSMTKGEIVGQN